MSTAIRFLGISGSLRQKSRNSGLLRYAADHLPAGVTMEIADISALPLYNEDTDNDAQRPPSATNLIKQIQNADALVLACPEYNYSLAPALKNALDWASRVSGNVALAGKAVAIMGAAGGMGSSRSQYHLRQSCIILDLRPITKPEVFSNAFSASFNDDGDLVDASIQAQVVSLLEALSKACS